MAKYKASDLLVNSLETEEVKHIFGVPGEENEDFLFSLEKSKITFIPTRHEQGAAFMADVWGRVTGKAGVCLATLGPGATNLLTGLADAQLDNSPVVAITGQGDTDRLHKESHQAIDVVGMIKPIAKWNTSIQQPKVIPEVVRKAFKVSQAEKPGVTHLELPEDVAKVTVEGEPIKPLPVRRPAPDHKAIEQVIAAIKAAKRPIILAGNGAIRKLASKHLRELVKKLNIPVVATFMGKGAVDDRAPQSLGAIGVMGRDLPLCAIEAADLIITVGYDVVEYDPAKWNTNASRPIVHIDFTPSEVYSSYQPIVEVVADISATLWELNQQLQSQKQFHSWYHPVRQAIDNDRLFYTELEDASLTVPRILSVLRQSLKPDDIVISDVGAHKMWVGRNYPTYEPGSVIISNGFASMGIAVPGGIAAKLARPDKHVVAINGDGGFLMNSQEIETAKRLGIGYTILLVNDNNYGLISWKQAAHNDGRSFGTALTNPDFVLYAKSFGVHVYNPKTIKEVAQSLNKAVTSRALSIVTIDINSEANMDLTKRLDKNLCPNFSF